LQLRVQPVQQHQKRIVGRQHRAAAAAHRRRPAPGAASAAAVGSGGWGSTRGSARAARHACLWRHQRLACPVGHTQVTQQAGQSTVD
jgi:hypothetical protein